MLDIRKDEFMTLVLADYIDFPSVSFETGSRHENNVAVINQITKIRKIDESISHPALFGFIRKGPGHTVLCTSYSSLSERPFCLFSISSSLSYSSLRLHISLRSCSFSLRSFLMSF